MGRILVLYHSRGGNTARMAQLVAEGAREKGATVDLRPVEEVSPDDLLDYDGIIAGSPTYYGQMSAELKRLLDESAMLIHGMVIQGTPQGDHYGPVAVGAPDERAAKQCRALGERVAELVDKLA